MKDPILFSDILFGWLTDRLDKSQKDEIDSQITADPDLQSLVDDLNDSQKVGQMIKEMDSFDVDKAWQNVSRKINSTSKHKTSTVKRLLRKYLIPVAAAAVIVGVIMLMPFNHTSVNEVQLDTEIETAMAECDSHGMSGAVIETDFVLPAKPQSVKSIRSKPVDNTQTNKSLVSEMLAAKRVTTLHNKEYWLTLPDGTVVHLARNTRIIYPDRFAENQRDVYLEGEGYFIVAKDKSKKFVVHTKSTTTVVYGTEFNVYAPESDDCQITLVTGSIGVTADNGPEIKLTPGEQANVVDGQMSVAQADLEPIKAWNSGHTEFEDWTLGRVMEILAKWHGMKSNIIDPDIAGIRLTGNLDRYDDLQPTLESLSELVGVKFFIADDTISASR